MFSLATYLKEMLRHAFQTMTFQSSNFVPLVIVCYTSPDEPCISSTTILYIQHKFNLKEHILTFLRFAILEGV